LNWAKKKKYCDGSFPRRPEQLSPKIAAGAPKTANKGKKTSIPLPHTGEGQSSPRQGKRGRENNIYGQRKRIVSFAPANSFSNDQVFQIIAWAKRKDFPQKKKKTKG